MRHPNSLAQFMAAGGWLKQFRKIKALIKAILAQQRLAL
jgi:hypothetical protein